MGFVHSLGGVLGWGEVVGALENVCSSYQDIINYKDIMKTAIYKKINGKEEARNKPTGM